jgi:antitoxin ParD1/3/4
VKTSTSCQFLPNSLFGTHEHHEHFLARNLENFLDTQFIQRGYGTSSEYMRELIRKDQDRLQLREKLLSGAFSAPGSPIDGTYIHNLRERVHQVTFRVTAL